VWKKKYSRINELYYNPNEMNSFRMEKRDLKLVVPSVLISKID